MHDIVRNSPVLCWLMYSLRRTKMEKLFMEIMYGIAVLSPISLNVSWHFTRDIKTTLFRRLAFFSGPIWGIPYFIGALLVVSHEFLFTEDLDY